jgi:hypothetical protein
MRWSVALRRLGVHPIFPLREDVQVGDIYLSRTQPVDEKRQLLSNGFIPLDLFMARLDLNEEISKFYGTRFLFPETKSYNASGGYIDRSYFDSCATRTPCDPRMMRLVTFPAFASINVSRNICEDDIYQFIPPETLSFLKGCGCWGQVRGLTVGTAMAESYSVPVEAAYRKFAKDFRETDALGKLIGTMRVITLPSDPGGGVNFWTSKPPPSCFSYVRLITEIYAVRTLDITLKTGPNSGMVDGYGGFVPLGGVRVDRLNKMLEENQAAATSGGHVRFISYGPEGIAMRRTFARPIIIGFRGVLVRINSLDNSSEMVGIIDSNPNLNRG